MGGRRWHDLGDGRVEAGGQGDARVPGARHARPPGAGPPSAPTSVVNLRLTFVGASRPTLVPQSRSATKVLFFVGHTSASWHANVPVWNGVTLAGLYPGISLELSGAGGVLQPTIVAAAGADLSDVRLRVEGAEALSLSGGVLHAKTAIGDVALPLLATAGATAQPAVTGDVVDAPFGTPGPRPRDQQSGLVYSTYVGGNGGDYAMGIAVDASGDAYIAGQTSSTNFPTTPGAFQTTSGSGLELVFVTEVNAGGTALVYSTYLAGSGGAYGFGDSGYALALDGSGDAYRDRAGVVHRLSDHAGRISADQG